VGQVRSYLAAAPGADLTARQRRNLTWNLLGGLVTDSDLDAVLDLLRASSPDDLQMLFQDGGLAAKLSSAIPGRHPLRGKLNEFVVARFDVNDLNALTRLDGWQVLDSGFRPEMIDPSLPDRTEQHLGQGQFLVAMRAANERG
jgi:hypothetical protein